MGERRKNQVNHRPGRPRAIPQVLIPVVLTLYKGGLGYRAIAHELRADGISVDWSTVRRLIKAKIDTVANEREASEGF